MQDNRDLKIERERAGVTQEQLAEQLHVSQAIVSLFERGLREDLVDGRGREEYRAALLELAQVKS